MASSKNSPQNFLAGFNIKSLLFSATILIFGIGVRGDWILMVVNFLRYYREYTKQNVLPTEDKFENLSYFILSSLVVSFTIFYGIGGFLQWKFYIKQRNNPKDWKCQPDKFLSWKDEKHEIILGSVNMAIGAIVSGVLSCFTNNGGKINLYYNIDEHSWIYFLISIPLMFLYQDAAAYYAHRALHLPSLYKRFHKMHHRYKQPTAFSTTAMHPVEFLFFQSLIALPLFFGPPVHWMVYMPIVLYMYYYGIMDHSGIKMTHFWPWQPESMFHDDHHKYFHVNFGFNSPIWDRLHNTVRKEDRIYSEKIFYGHGKTKDQLTKEEIEDLGRDD